MDIVILSSGRPLKQTTWASLPESLQGRTTVVVPAAEVDHYIAANPGMNVFGVQVKGVGTTRQWIVENYPDHVAMLDDDLVFATRRADNPTKFYNASHDEIVDLFKRIDAALYDFAHVGVATREGGNWNTNKDIETTRMLRVLCYDTRILRQHDIRFDQMELMEDFDVTLRLLRRGYANLVLNHMVQNQNGSNLLGGCSQYRTSELQEQAAYRLKARHPDFVKVVKKTTKGAWGDMKERIDVIVQWKKALRADI